ncbi:hypothetical protein [Gracilibacillus saliphilus]|uniref:hypothetical protein n=1 Tax=Gracilibacillus saliphilus TaxID=543890 RepID=UPI0013D38B7B|nr:hypothetical protein [Gracilibacillus saliphilus]
MQPAIKQDYYRSHLENQLAKHGYTDVEGMTEKELIAALAYQKAKQIKIDCDSNKWF